MDYKYKIFFLVLAGSIFAARSTGFAQPSISDRKKQIAEMERRIEEKPASTISNESTIEDYIKVGLMRNPDLKAAFYKWKSAFNKVSQAFSLPDPQFTFTEYIEEVETRVGPQERAYSIKQKFPLPDKLWIRKSYAFKASEVAYHNFGKQRLSLIYKITDAYYEYAYLSKAILLTEENIKLLKSFESVAQVRYKAALVQNQDLLKVQVELGTLENDLYSLRDLKVPLAARLNALLNLPADNPLPWPKDLLEDGGIEGKYKDTVTLYDTLKEKNPQLLAFTQNVEKSKDALKLAQRDFFPDLTVGVTQIDTADALMSNVSGSGKDPLMVMFSVNVPIWFHRLNAGVQEKRAALRAAENSLKNKENELASELALIHYKLFDALRQSRLYKDALLPKAIQTLNATQSGYEGGKVDFLSLIDAQRVLLNFQLAYYRHNANLHQRLAELRSLLGEIKEYTE